MMFVRCEVLINNERSNKDTVSSFFSVSRLQKGNGQGQYITNDHPMQSTAFDVSV